MNNASQISSRTGISAAVSLNGLEVGQLLTGGSLSIGSDPGSDIPLAGDGISAIHCMLISNGHGVMLRDCFSKTGTYFDGQRVTEAKLKQGAAAVRIGETELTVTVFGTQRPTQSGPTSSAEVELELQLQAAHNEILILTERIARTKTLPPEPPADDAFRDELVELLRMEIDELQRALGEREQAAAPSVSDRNADVVDQTSPADTELLVGRLEQLLDELQQKDEQVALLHTLLETAEEANRAEQEEREQLNAWIPDIEKRFAQRELEWQANYERLEADNLRIATERDRAEAAAVADTDSAKLEAVQRLARELRMEAESIREKLRKTENHNQYLQREIESVQASVSREEVVRLARERAELARMRHDLEAQSLAVCNKAARTEQSVDTDIRVLRRHLQEVHEQEKLEREQRSLSSRIAGLWKRIDSR